MQRLRIVCDWELGRVSFPPTSLALIDLLPPPARARYIGFLARQARLRCQYGLGRSRVARGTVLRGPQNEDSNKCEEEMERTRLNWSSYSRDLPPARSTVTYTLNEAGQKEKW